MSRLLYSQNPVERTERLVDLLDLRKDWNAGVFTGCVFEHMLPVFESIYRHLIKPFNRPGEQAERSRLERSVHEVFGITSRNFQPSPPHQRMMQLIAEYAFLGQRLAYPITEWSKEELYKEYDMAYFWSSVWAIVGTGATATDAGKLVLETVGSIAAAGTIVRLAGPAGKVITIAGALSAMLTTYYFSREKSKIREEVRNRINAGEITKQEWENYEVTIWRRYDV